jgi:DNA-binding MarR family transcriptional regulator/GNAT superfamily N-acetyltransferase
MDAAAVQKVRSFNRTVAERIGALTDEFLGLSRPMGESRTLWEIGGEGADVRELRARLGLDSGYMSRVLRSLTRQGLVTVRVSPDDRRVRRAQLTDAGRRECAELDRRSDEMTWGFLEPLSRHERSRLVSALSEAERLLRGSMATLAAEDPNSADARWCLEQYYAELRTRFEMGYDPAVTIPVPAAELVLPTGAFVVARLRGRPVGCGALRLHPGEPAEIKRMWIAREARGLGLGRRLLGELERLARQAGATVIHLETNRALGEAIAMYRSSGYREVEAFNFEPYAHHWFEKQLTT